MDVKCENKGIEISFEFEQACAGSSLGKLLEIIHITYK
jgi:hypothetical protein